MMGKDLSAVTVSHRMRVMSQLACGEAGVLAPTKMSIKPLHQAIGSVLFALTRVD